jgi:5'-3' exonuclease
MGIPSFYRHLLRKYKGITAGNLAGVSLSSVDLLALDFNCIIYSAMKTMPNAFSPSYEEDLIREVGVWLDRLFSMIPSTSIYIAVDGAVPCAKIHQQRLRRYKSAYMNLEDKLLRAQLGLPEKEEGWDRNAITPGTQFMEKINKFLVGYSKKHSGIIVSGTNEPGEGEHKIMRYLKNTKAQNVVIYGMDADLILLGMLKAEQTDRRGKIVLVREKDEVKDTSQITLQFFAPSAAAEAMWKESGSTASLQDWIFDYVAIMSVLGNDFLPHSLGFSIREDGINELLVSLEDCCVSLGSRLTSSDEQGRKINVLVMQKIFEFLASGEERKVTSWLRQKEKWYPPALKSTEQWERAVEERESEPMRRRTEMFLFAESKGGGWVKPDWRNLLEEHHFSGKCKDAALKFLQGFAWVHAYYLDCDSVDMSWYYPWSAPPTFKTLAYILSVNGLPSLAGKRSYVKPLEQLVMVLPPQSFHLLPSRIAEMLRRDHFEYIPYGFQLEMFGKRFLWECEPKIPFLPRSLAEKICS